MFTQPLLIYILSSNAILTRRIKKIIMIDNKNKILFFFQINRNPYNTVLRAMSSPDTSLNRSTSSTNSDSSLKLIIKAANQKYEDFIIDEFELSWTIKRLKLYLTENYPQKPVSKYDHRV
jgi:hypothetical protein